MTTMSMHQMHHMKSVQMHYCSKWWTSSKRNIFLPAWRGKTNVTGTVYQRSLWCL